MGHTPLMKAAAYGHVDMVRLLLAFAWLDQGNLRVVPTTRRFP
jgi:ankyrin repeat protein